MTLLGPDFVRELSVLRRRLDIRARSGGGGEHLAKRRGGSAEFQEHRAYAPGDDMRRIDWAAYARTGEPVLKLFRAEEDVVARLVCDASASLGYGEPRKIDAARRLAAAVGYMALANAERAQLFLAGAGITEERAPVRGRGGIPALLRALEDAETGAVVEVTMDAAAVEAYALRFAGLCEELRAFARKHRAAYVRARTDEPLEGAVRRIVARSVD